MSVVDDLFTQLTFLYEGQVNRNWVDVSTLVQISQDEHLTMEFIDRFNSLTNSNFQDMVKFSLLRYSGDLSDSADRYDTLLTLPKSYIPAVGAGLLIGGAGYTFTGSATVMMGAAAAAPLLVGGVAILGLGVATLYWWSAKRRAKLAGKRTLTELRGRL